MADSEAAVTESGSVAAGIMSGSEGPARASSSVCPAWRLVCAGPVVPEVWYLAPLPVVLHRSCLVPEVRQAEVPETSACRMSATSCAGAAISSRRGGTSKLALESPRQKTVSGLPQGAAGFCSQEKALHKPALRVLLQASVYQSCCIVPFLPGCHALSKQDMGNGTSSTCLCALRLCIPCLCAWLLSTCVHPVL